MAAVVELILPFLPTVCYDKRWVTNPESGVTDMSNMLDFLELECLKTGTPYADYQNRSRYAQMPEVWALVAYLADKGVIDKAEYYDYLGHAYGALVRSIENSELYGEVEKKMDDLGI